MQAQLEKLGSNFFVAGFAPALAFTAVALIIFEPVLPAGPMQAMQSLLAPLGGIGPLIILTIVLGFTMSSLNTYLYKLFEGYFFLERFGYLKVRQRRRVRRLQHKLAQVTYKLKILQNGQSASQESSQLANDDVEIDQQVVQEWQEIYDADVVEVQADDPEVVRLQNQRYALAASIDRIFPGSHEYVLPTRFGNLLRAAEAYPGQRYGMDAVLFWPRLIHVMPPSYYEKVEHSNNQLAFLINCSVLNMILAWLCIGAVVYQAVMANCAAAISLQQLTGQQTCLFYFMKLDVGAEIYQQRALLYMLSAGVFVGAFWLFYQASLAIVTRHGDMVRSSFDLFRFALLKELRQPLPNDSLTEFQDWATLSEWIAFGQSLRKIKLSYKHPQAQTGASKTTDSETSAH